MVDGRKTVATVAYVVVMEADNNMNISGVMEIHKVLGFNGIR